MFKIFVNSWKTKEIRNKILYTLMIFAIVRLGTQIALPGIDTAGVIAARENASMAGTLYSVIAGGANSSWSIFAMGIGPYINASISLAYTDFIIASIVESSRQPRAFSRTKRPTLSPTILSVTLFNGDLNITLQSQPTLPTDERRTAVRCTDESG